MINYQANLHIIGFACSKKDEIMLVKVYRKDLPESKFEMSL